jgi:hypothetical protein
MTRFRGISGFQLRRRQTDDASERAETPEKPKTRPWHGPCSHARREHSVSNTYPQSHFMIESRQRLRFMPLTIAYFTHSTTPPLSFPLSEGHVMRLRKSPLLTFSAALASAAAIIAVSPPAAADPGHASAAALLGYGFKDGVGLGLGVRGGYTLPANVYLGGTFVYHLGKSESTPAGDYSVNIFYFGVEGGYDIDVAPVVIRPYLGLGDAVAKASIPQVCFSGTCVGGGSQSEGHFAAWPGVSVLYPVDHFFVGGDARFLIVSDSNAFSIFATGGMNF